MAFFLPTTFALSAFPRTPALRPATLLGGCGAAIELIQAIPAFGRNGDVLDWLADTVAVAAVF